LTESTHSLRQQVAALTSELAERGSSARSLLSPVDSTKAGDVVDASVDEEIDAIVQSALAGSHCVSVTPVRQSSVARLPVGSSGRPLTDASSPPLPFKPSLDDGLPPGQLGTGVSASAAVVEPPVDANWKAQKVIRNHMF
jgi:hypothetical protein